MDHMLYLSDQFTGLDGLFMLDKIHMFIPFKIDVISILGDVDRSPTLHVDLASMGVPMRARGVLADGQGGYTYEDLSHAWESLPSSYTPMAVKVFHQSLGKRLNPGVELKASPAKLLQGHNVFGPTSIRMGAEVMLKWLAGSYPQLWAMLDVLSIQVYALDCTYSARLPDERTSRQLIQALRGVSNGQTRNRGDDYETTAYWGSKETRLRKLKAYLKSPEFLRELDTVTKCARGGNLSSRRVLQVMSDSRLLAWVENLIRLEATVMHRWLDRRGIPSELWALCDHQEQLASEGRCFIQECWEAVTKELFAAFEGITMRVINDEKVLAALIEKHTKVGKGRYTKEKTVDGVVVPSLYIPGKSSDAYARNLFRTYRSLKEYGWDETKESMNTKSSYNHINDICACGLSKAALQKLKQDDQKNNIVPILRFLQVDFSAQRPHWYIEPSVEAA